MGEGIISRRGGGGYATINFNLPASPPTKSVATSLSEAKYGMTAASIGNHALFFGGRDTRDSADAFSAMVTVYGPTLERTFLPPLDTSSTMAYLSAATTVGNYLLFGGGQGYNTYSSFVFAYSSNLNRTYAPYLSEGRHSLAATTVGNYALFGGGQTGAGSMNDWFNTVDAYDTTLNRTTPPALSERKSLLAATTVGNYALFGGGYDREDTVDAYDTTLARTTPPALSEGRHSLAATTVGNYALFGGGYSGVYSSTVDVYYKTLTKTTPIVLSQARSGLAATTAGDYAIFAGGEYYSSGYHCSNVVDIFHSTLVRIDSEPLVEAKKGLAATTVENYALFGGGKVSDGVSTDVVDAYSVEKHDVQLFPETKYSFNGTAESTSSTWQTISILGKLTGYMKIKSAQIN